MWYYEIISEFFYKIDAYIKKNLTTISGHELSENYAHLWSIVKLLRGTARGFDGFAEFLIFRFLLHIFGGDWELMREKSSFIYYFENNLYHIKLVPQYQISSDTRRVDIGILYYDELRRLIEISAYPPNLNEFINNINFLTQIIQNYPETQVLGIIFLHLPPQGNNIVQLSERGQVIYLKNYQLSFYDFICGWLGDLKK